MHHSTTLSGRVPGWLAILGNSWSVLGVHVPPLWTSSWLACHPGEFLVGSWRVPTPLDEYLVGLPSWGIPGPFFGTLVTDVGSLTQVH